MGSNPIVVIGDKDGGKVAELDASNCLPVNSFSKGSGVLHRYGAAGTGYYLNINDASVPAVGNGVDVSSYSRVVIVSRISGDGVSWDLVPLYGDASVGVYASGDKITVVGDAMDTIESGGFSDFYVLCRNKAGTDAGIKVYVAGYSS